MNKEEFFEKLKRLKHDVEGRDHLILICNPLFFKDFDLKRIKNLLEIKRHISIKDKEYVCVINTDGYIPPLLNFSKNLLKFILLTMEVWMKISDM